MKHEIKKREESTISYEDGDQTLSRENPGKPQLHGRVMAYKLTIFMLR